MASAYANAEIFVFPSHFEGFGLPALEAMAAGTPTILARASSLPEVGGDASFYFEPGSVTDLAVAIEKVRDDSLLRETLITRGIERAREFSWTSTAAKTAAVYQQSLA